MAVVFNLDDITAEVKKDLIKELTFIPIDPYVEKMKKWGKPVMHVTPKTPVQMFKVDKDTRTVRIPFNVAMSRMGAHPNMHKVFPKLDKNGPPKFHASLRDSQPEVTKTALKQLKENRSTTLGLPPGWGKTIVGSYLGSKVNGPMMVFVHRGIIADAWMNTFRLCFPQLAKMIWYVGEIDPEDGVVLDDEFIREYNKDKPDDKKIVPGVTESVLSKPKIRKNAKSKNKDVEIYEDAESKTVNNTIKVPAIIICLYGRIQHVPQYIRDTIAVTIIDEAHLFCTPDKVECLLATEPKYVIAETATLFRKDEMHSMIQSIVGCEGIFRVPDKPHRVYRIKTNIRVPTEQGARGLNFTDLTHKLINDAERNNQIIDCIMCNPHRKPMIMVRYKEHIPLLKDLLEEKGKRVATLYGNQKNYSDSDVLIGTIPKMGVGFDEKNACPDFQGRASDLILLVTSIADVNLYEQVKGRGMRSDDPVIFYFEDKIGIVKRHIDNIEGWIEQTLGVIYEFPYEEGAMFIPNMRYENGEGIEVPLLEKNNKDNDKNRNNKNKKEPDVVDDSGVEEVKRNKVNIKIKKVVKPPAYSEREEKEKEDNKLPRPPPPKYKEEYTDKEKEEDFDPPPEYYSDDESPERNSKIKIGNQYY